MLCGLTFELLGYSALLTSLHMHKAYSLHNLHTDTTTATLLIPKTRQRCKVKYTLIIRYLIILNVVFYAKGQRRIQVCGPLGQLAQGSQVRSYTIYHTRITIMWKDPRPPPGKCWWHLTLILTLKAIFGYILAKRVACDYKKPNFDAILHGNAH